MVDPYGRGYRELGGAEERKTIIMVYNMKKKAIFNKKRKIDVDLTGVETK